MKKLAITLAMIAAASVICYGESVAAQCGIRGAVCNAVRRTATAPLRVVRYRRAVVRQRQAVPRPAAQTGCATCQTATTSYAAIMAAPIEVEQVGVHQFSYLTAAPAPVAKPTISQSFRCQSGVCVRQ